VTAEKSARPDVDGWPGPSASRDHLVDLGAEFARRHVSPHLQEWEDAGEVPRELYLKAAKQGLLGIGFAEEVGGEGGTLADVVAVSEGVLAEGASSGLLAALFTHGIALPHIAAHGSAHLVDRYVRPTLAGELIGSLAITEPGGGSTADTIAAAALAKQTAVQACDQSSTGPCSCTAVSATCTAPRWSGTTATPGSCPSEEERPK
jgi:alkylation response protein AidB-like acyl-CoA dehydrogenase